MSDINVKCCLDVLWRLKRVPEIDYLKDLIIVLGSAVLVATVLRRWASSTTPTRWRCWQRSESSSCSSGSVWNSH